ncbi:4-hydroxy-tetrahydrodipicolinate reductase [Candidatus Poribacteria bacterium]|nr:4-hydroxy-tetrahydrodipicolinate reductase [Candidatus Poribacteria bacterium]
MLKVTVIGARGRMGQLLVAAVAKAQDMELVGAVEAPDSPAVGQDAGEIAGIGRLDVNIVDSNSLSEALKDADVAINFSAPKEVVLDHLRTAAKSKTSMVIGTTGFTEEEMDTIKELTSSMPCVMAPNMSFGVNVLLKVVKDVAEILGNDYDIEIIETHHHFKKDSPSGTANRIAKVIAEALDRDLEEVGVYGREGMVGERSPKEIGIHAVRAGDVVGDHVVIFGGIGERLEIAHKAQSRDPLVNGALKAARWVVNASDGLHDISEVLGL